MKFTLSKTNRFWWPVQISLPDPAHHGKMMTQTLKVLFEPEDRDQALADAEKRAALSDAGDVPGLVELDVQIALRRIKGWDDIVDDEGAPVPFSEDNLRIGLGQTWFRRAIDKALSESLNGEEARLGN